MSLMLDALKALQQRNVDEPVIVLGIPPRNDSPEKPAREQAVAAEPDSVVNPVTLRMAEPAAVDRCVLPFTTKIAPYYLETAGRIEEQLANNYSNVVLFIALDAAARNRFSLPRLAQAFAAETPGDVLVVDGDLRVGRLSLDVCPQGQGMIEVMLGERQWPEVIRPTNSPQIDFVSCGNREIPTLERREFGWGALRPMYHTVLIGLAPAEEPETRWLAARCDAVYVVISRSQTRRQAATAAVSALRCGGVNLLGCVVVDD